MNNEGVRNVPPENGAFERFEKLEDNKTGQVEI